MLALNPGFYDENDLRSCGFRSIGKNVRIAKNCTVVGAENIEIGSNVRIDGYCSVFAAEPGTLRIGSHVHVGSYCLLSAGDGIVLEDFSGLSQGVRIYSRTDDYSGEYLTNPTVPPKYTGGVHGPVVISRHVIIGSGSVVLPNVTIGEGSAVGAMSLVTKSLEPWGIFFGCPAKRIKSRSNQLLRLEQALLATRSQ